VEKKRSLKTLLLCTLLPLAGGGAVALATMNAMKDYDAVAKPPLAPPTAVFPIAWTLLYLLMGYALYRSLRAAEDGLAVQRSLRTFTSQLLINYLWPFIFFTFKTYWAAAVCLLFLILLVLMTRAEFAKNDKTAARLLIPYIVWLVFALYLNIGTAVLNN